MQRCQLGIGCARGHQCENGVCCAMPMCSTGLIAASICGMGNSCPMGFVCEEAVARNRYHSVQMVAVLLSGAELEPTVHLDSGVRHWEDAACCQWNQYVHDSLTPFANVRQTVPVPRVLYVQWGHAAPNVRIANLQKMW
nr:putative chitin binding Peritrophin-A domain [Haemonchus contortus]